MMPVQAGGRIPLLPFAASLALALAAGTVGCGAPPDALHPRSTPGVRLTGGQLPGSGLPRYFADIVRASGSVEGAGPVQIRSSATASLARRQPSTDALAIAAYDGGGKLLIARQAGEGCSSRLYRAALSADGRLGKLTRLGPLVRGIVTSVATDTSASLIGYFAGGCVKPASGYLAVLNTRTGKARRWSGAAVNGSGGSVVADKLSMSASGSVVVFTGAAAGTGGRFIGQRVWELRTSASAGPIGARSRVVLSRPNSGPALSSVILSPGGRSFYLCTVSTKGMVSAHRTVAQTAVITVRRTSSGTSTGTVAKLTATGVTFPGEGFGCPMAVTSNGRYLLAPYQLRYGNSTTVPPLVTAAVLSTSSHTRRFIAFRLPGSAGMSVATGLSIAW